MKRMTIILAAALLVAGCAGSPELDREFGRASRQTWERQIANPAGLPGTAEGLAGNTAEEIMAVHNGTFAEPPEKVDIFTMGVSGDTGKRR